MNLLPEYAWSEAEPALAIICACMVTYRPLFANLKLDLSRVSSIFSHNSVEGSKGGSTSDSSTIGWAGRENYNLRVPELSMKVASQGPRVVQVDLGSSRISPVERPYQQLSATGDGSKGVQKPSKPEYQSLPFVMERRESMVSPCIQGQA